MPQPLRYCAERPGSTCVHRGSLLRMTMTGMLLAVAGAGGCHLHDSQHHQQTHDKLRKLLHNERPFLENPLYVPECDREFIWQQLVDAVDDHFEIEREERIRVIGNVMTRGEITTFPTSAATLLEPWRTNSVGARSRLMATLQSQRKYAVLQLIPADNGYQVALEVHVEQEDLDRPERSTVGGASIRHDGSIARVDEQLVDSPPVQLGWIPLGRDTLLEQRILTDIRDRLSPAYASP